MKVCSTILELDIAIFIKKTIGKFIYYIDTCIYVFISDVNGLN